MAEWQFAKIEGNQVRREPSEWYLFRTTQSTDGEYAGNDQLVRETIQNSLDARAPDSGFVRVRLSVHEAEDGPSDARLEHYFARLEPAIKKTDFRLRYGSMLAPCRFLVCEDFGTRGLEGDPQLFRDPNPGERPEEFFYWFWRNIGRSSKSNEDLGRWGLGKTVFRAASQLGAMLGLTVRRSDGGKFLMGQVVSRIHSLDGVDYHPEGFWCNGKDLEGVVRPISSDKEISHFSSEWHLERKNEPGLSVVVPFVPEELKPERLAEAVVANYFWRILRRELVVEVVGSRFERLVIDCDTIENVAKQLEWSGPKRAKRDRPPPLGFARACLANVPVELPNVLGEKRIPDSLEPAFSPEGLSAFRKQFAAEQPISFCVGLALPEKKGGAQIGKIAVHLQKVSDSRNADEADARFVREGMTIPKPGAEANRLGVRALAVVDDGPLARLLGDTEGPSHDDWDTSETRPAQFWTGWKGRVKFVREILKHAVAVLSPPPEQPDRDLLREFFSVHRSAGGQPKTRAGGPDDSSNPFAGIASAPKWYSIRETRGGFAVCASKVRPIPPEASLLVEVAYDLDSGNPFARWTPLDFQFGNDSLEMSGVGVKVTKTQAGNRVELRSLVEDFRFTVKGFDEHRDLVVNVRELGQDSRHDE